MSYGKTLQVPLLSGHPHYLEGISRACSREGEVEKVQGLRPQVCLASRRVRQVVFGYARNPTDKVPDFECVCCKFGCFLLCCPVMMGVPTSDRSAAER